MKLSRVFIYSLCLVCVSPLFAQTKQQINQDKAKEHYFHRLQQTQPQAAAVLKLTDMTYQVKCKHSLSIASEKQILQVPAFSELYTIYMQKHANIGMLKAKKVFNQDPKFNQCQYQ